MCYEGEYTRGITQLRIVKNCDTLFNYSSLWCTSFYVYILVLEIQEVGSVIDHGLHEKLYQVQLSIYYFCHILYR